MNFIAAVWNVRDANSPRGIRNSIIRSVDHDHHGAHFRMDIAKEKANTDAIKADRACRASFVKAQIKTLSFEQREDIVKKRIAIREINDCTNLDGQEMRFKYFMTLHQSLSLGR